MDITYAIVENAIKAKRLLLIPGNLLVILTVKWTLNG